jgi:hypothetical protein
MILEEELLKKIKKKIARSIPFPFMNNFCLKLTI